MLQEAHDLAVKVHKTKDYLKSRFQSEDLEYETRLEYFIAWRKSGGATSDFLPDSELLKKEILKFEPERYQVQDLDIIIQECESGSKEEKDIIEACMKEGYDAFTWDW